MTEGCGENARVAVCGITQHFLCDHVSVKVFKFLYIYSAASNHNHSQRHGGHLGPHRYFNGIKCVAVDNNHSRSGKDVVDVSIPKRIKDIALHGSVRR